MKKESTFNDLPMVVAQLRDEVVGMKQMITNLQSQNKPQKANTQTKGKPKGRFFWYAIGIYKPKEPSLWFVVYGLLEIRHATSLTTGAKHWHR